MIFADSLMARFEVSKCVWSYMASICIVYFVTLSLFPGIESEIVSCRFGSWMPILLIAVFNLFDFIGKVRCCLSSTRSLDVFRLLVFELVAVFWPTCITCC